MPEAVPAPAVPAAPHPAAPAVVEGAKVDASGKPLAPPAPPAPAAPPPAPPAPAAPPPVTEPPKDSQRFALLTKQAQQLQADRARFRREHQAAKQALDAERQAYEAKQAQDAKDLAEYRALRLRAKIDVDGFQKHFYGDNWYPTISQYVASDKQPTAALVAADLDEKIAQKTAEVEQKADARFKALETERLKQVQESDAQTERRFARDVAAWVGQKAEKYDLINRTQQHWRVADLVKRKYNQDGEIISVEEAADAVEKYLEQEGKTYLDSPKLKPAQPAPAAPPAVQPEPPREPRRSLNNDLVSGTPQSFATPGIISDEDAVKRALAAYQKNRTVQR